MKEVDIQKLIDRYLEGQTSPDEEQRLAHELLRPDLPEEWQAIRLMLGELAMGEAEYDAIMAERLQQLITETAAENKKTAVIKMRYRWMAIAASLLFIIGIGAFFTFNGRDAERMQEPVVAKAERVKATAPSNTTKEDKPVEVQRPTEKPKKSPLPVKPHPQKAQPARKDSVKQQPSVRISVPEKGDPNLHYASHEVTKDTVSYQDPGRVDEFIARFAAYNNIKQGELTCSLPVDSNVVSTVYVFPDEKEVDVFGRLLQVACWYKSETPGYFLNFSHQQFFFELKDMRQQLQYRWIAERVNGKILLYGTHAPLGTKETSTCYQEYRNELMHIKSINTKTREI